MTPPTSRPLATGESPETLLTVKDFRSNRASELWVLEDPDAIRKRMRDCRELIAIGTDYSDQNIDGPMIRVSMVMALRVRDYWTREDNIISVEAYK